ncbi:MAG TPA: GAF domain-containing sensor histidine kinase [Anaerolineales bacterium]|nr:GAF domain-containing sensor histidine kinase [Anaerolineales bacterium]
MVVLTREQLEDRLAALHHASLQLVGDLSLETVLDRIVRMAREQAGAEYAALGVVDEDGNLVKFLPVGIEQNQIDRMEHPPVGKGLLGMFYKERRTIRIPEISADPRSAGFPPHHPEMHSFLGVPIILGDHLFGQIYLTNKQNYHEFTESDERVIETLATYAAVAISNARLYNDLQIRDEALSQRNEDLALLNVTAAALTGSLDVDSILDQTLTRVMNYLDVESGEIFLREENEKELRLVLFHGDNAEAFWTRDRFRVGEGIIGEVAETGKPLINFDPRGNNLFLRKAVPEAGFKCMAVIPMLARGNVLGVISVATRQERCIGEREVNMLTAIASWAATTIENARLHRQGRRLAVLEERERIGMDLHDGIIQSIYGVGLALDYARMALDDNPQSARQKIDQSIEALNSTIHDIRAYILDLRPRLFHGQDLMEGLQRLVDEFKANSKIEVTLAGPDAGLIDFPAENATILFHICQEALANVAKHSQARRVDVRLWTARDRVLLEVADNGGGFDIRKMNFTLGHGLSNMHTRARKVGGDVEINSFPSEGTNVLAWVPRRA